MKAKVFPMKPWKLLWIFVFMTATCFSASLSGGSPSGEEFCLAESGQPACTIVIAGKATPAARLAALELQYHFLKITGAAIPVAPDDTRIQGRRILVGESRATRELGFGAKDFDPQEFLVAFRTNAIVLLGKDWEDTEANRKVEGRPMAGDTLQSARHKIDFWKTVGIPQRSAGEMELPGLFDDQATCLAAYDFLERCCGVRWYGPAELNVVIPSRSTLVVKGSDVRRAPALKHRAAFPAGNWPFLRGQWGDFTRDQVHLYWRRSRQGGERWAANHTFHRETIKSFFNDPEYECKNPKGRGSQLCFSNPKLVSKVAGMARDYFDRKGELPSGWKALGDYFAVVPDDNLNLCTCDACQALLKQGAGRKTGQFSSGQMSDYWFTFVNAVAREVRLTHPDKYIATLAYWAYAVPPDFPIEPNVSIAPCLHTCTFAIHPEMRENDLRLYEGWRRKVTAPMFLWVYYHHPMEPALIDRWNCFPNVMVHRTSEAMKMFIRDGVRGIFECGEQDQLEQYIMAKVWDDPGSDVDALIDEFFAAYFGPAAAPMKKFYLRLEEIACDPGNYSPPYRRKDAIEWRRVAWERLGTEEHMRELGAFMERGRELADADPWKQRVALWRSALWDWMRTGREQHLASQKAKEAK
jgi:hypothetical protein